jgi:hypothetical protein
MVSSKGRTWLYVGITSFKGKLGLIFLFLLLALPAFASGGACPTGANYLNVATNTLVTLSSLGITSCYYVAANGSDSNDGLSEASGHPWLHAPGMPSATGGPAALFSSGSMAGIGIILRGGDTWHFGTSTAPSTGGTWNFNVSPYPIGTSSHPIYLGVDTGWPSTGWARPILTGDNATSTSNTLGACAHQISGDGNNMIDVSGLQYYIIDNFEMTGLCQDDAGQPNNSDLFVSYGSTCNTACPASGIPFVATNLYIHGWTHQQFAGSNGSGACSGAICINISAFKGSVVNESVNGSAGESIHNNVVDGSDSDPGGAGLCYGGFYDVAYNVFRYTSQCITGNLHLFHDNLYEYFFENGHSNVLESGNASDAAGTNAIYNNVFRHLEDAGVAGCGTGNNPPCSGGVGLWQYPPSGTTDYLFNNLIYAVGGIEFVNIGNNGGPTPGNYTIFNNTFQTTPNQTIFNCQYLTGGNLVDTNNHFIDDGTQYSSPCNTKTTTTALLETNAQATSKGYTASEAFTYSPTSSSSPTVGTGTNENASNGAFCSALSNAGLSDAANACQSDTAYGCTYSTSTHTISCPARTVTARPLTSAWNIGAYEYNTQDPPPVAPSGLTAVVN